MARMLWTAALGLLLAAPAAAQDAGEPSTIWDEGNGREQVDELPGRLARWPQLGQGENRLHPMIWINLGLKTNCLDQRRLERPLQHTRAAPDTSAYRIDS